MGKGDSNNDLKNANDDAKANPGQTQKVDIGDKSYGITADQQGTITVSPQK